MATLRRLLRSQSGFSLLELVVTLFLVTLILSLAVQLLGEVQLRFVDLQRSAPDPIPQLTVQLLRSDIQRSQRVVSALGESALRLQLPDGGEIRYEASLDRLTRVMVGANGQELGRRAVLRGVGLWKWRASPAGLVEVALAYRRHEGPGLDRRRSPRRLRDPGESLETLNLRFATRSTPGRRRW